MLNIKFYIFYKTEEDFKTMVYKIITKISSVVLS